MDNERSDSAVYKGWEGSEAAVQEEVVVQGCPLTELISVILSQLKCIVVFNNILCLQNVRY